MRTMAQISDIHLGEIVGFDTGIDPGANLIKVLEDIKSREISEVIITGDICSRDSAGHLYELLEKYGFKYSFVLGNHDDQVIMKDTFKMENKYYSYNDSGRTYIYLDSSQGVIDQVQLFWLRDELERIKENEVVLFVHHPILDCDNSIMDRQYPLLNRNEIESLINGMKHKTTVFCGHYHRADTREKGNIKQYVAPSTFYQLNQFGDKLEIENIPIGYRLIMIDKGIETDVVRID